jgi:phosphopantothenoylcysteine synthetase/decarboxylase
MKEVVSKEFPKADIYISSAAINDIEFDEAEEKIKKSDFSNTIIYKQAPDILQSVLGHKD